MSHWWVIIGESVTIRKSDIWNSTNWIGFSSRVDIDRSEIFIELD